LDTAEKRIARALDSLQIELPSRGFANTGSRSGEYLQPKAATCIDDKFAGTAQVHALTGACPTLALHIEWDLSNGVADVPTIRCSLLEQKYSIRSGSINPNLFQRQVIQVRFHLQA
jgi:L-rhamnose isomerase / sugar isomerase